MKIEGATRPTCTLIAGANGSGKSTIYDRFARPGRFVNADVIARELRPDDPTSASLLAGRRTLVELGRLLQARESFTYETTLSSRQSIELIHAAGRHGYKVELVFIVLRDASLHVARVAERVKRGGHDIPEHVVRRRYESALKRLPEALRASDQSMLFDNSLSSGPHLLLQIEKNAIEVNNLDYSDLLHCRLAEIASDAFGTRIGFACGSKHGHSTPS